MGEGGKRGEKRGQGIQGLGLGYGLTRASGDCTEPMKGPASVAAAGGAAPCAGAERRRGVLCAAARRWSRRRRASGSESTRSAVEAEVTEGWLDRVAAAVVAMAAVVAVCVAADATRTQPFSTPGHLASARSG